jgi:hypothetical protein
MDRVSDAMSASAVLNALLVLALVGWVLYRQTIARPVVARRLVILPGILAVIGGAAVSHVDNGNLSATAILYQNGVVALRGSRLGIPFASDYASRRRSGRIRSNIKRIGQRSPAFPADRRPASW